MKRRQRIFILVVLILSLITIYHFLPENEASRVQQLIIHPEDAKRLQPMMFMMFGVAVLSVPGVPATFLFLLAGRFYGIKEGMVIMCITNSIGTTVSFLIARFMCHNYINKVVESNLKLKALKTASKKNEWKICFLARFVLIPTQLKSYVFGISSVSLKCFVITALIGDLQSLFVTVYLGSLLRTNQNSKNNQIENILSAIGFFIAVFMSIIASYVARKSYKIALEELQNNQIKHINTQNRNNLLYSRHSIGSIQEEQSFISSV